MTVVYLPHTVSAVYRAETEHHHVRPAGDDMSRPFAIDCDACAPFLLRDGATTSAEKVPLTEDQVTEQERIEREGNLAVKQAAQALATSAATLVAEGTRKSTASD